MRSNNRELARRWFEEVWNERRVETIDELMAPGAVGGLEGAYIRGTEEFKAFRATLLRTFPDLRFELEGIVAEGDDVAVRWRATGTQQGEGFGIVATSVQVSFQGMSWLRFADGRIVQGSDSWNQGAVTEHLRAAAVAAAGSPSSRSIS